MFSYSFGKKKSEKSSHEIQSIDNTWELLNFPLRDSTFIQISFYYAKVSVATLLHKYIHCSLLVLCHIFFFLLLFNVVIAEDVKQLLPVGRQSSSH